MTKGKIEKLSQENARIIADTWKYDGIYSFYDMTADVDDYNEFINEESRNDNYFQYTYDSELSGFFSIELAYDTITLGLGLRPDLTGKGKGKLFLREIEEYVVLNYPSVSKIELAVAQFNIRALKLYESLGYIENNRVIVETNGGSYPFVQMSKNI